MRQKTKKKPILPVTIDICYCTENGVRMVKMTAADFQSFTAEVAVLAASAKGGRLV